MIREHPILFSTPMVWAIKSGLKQQTRRICTGQRENSTERDFAIDRSPYGVRGEYLWVRESFLPCHGTGTQCKISDARYVCFRDGDQKYNDGDYSKWNGDPPKWGTQHKFRPSIHMPRWASRFTLQITSVGVERLHEIREGDAIAEGFWPNDEVSSLERFKVLWAEINGKESWGQNPLVWVVTFDVVETTRLD
jgi:hypothetical protein